MRNKLDPDMKGRARELRNYATPAERILWKSLRNLNRQGFHFRCQVPFRRYILDFVEYGRKIVIEVDGDTHATSEARLRDDERDRLLHSEGYRVLRFRNSEIRENVEGAIVSILAEVEAPHPNPPHKGEGTCRV
jgi:very-short-patch-repair endonuclease